MAMSMGSGGSVKAEPNVTPMIDVMLVLLIIFMLVVPAISAGVTTMKMISSTSMTSIIGVTFGEDCTAPAPPPLDIAIGIPPLNVEWLTD